MPNYHLKKAIAIAVAAAAALAVGAHIGGMSADLSRGHAQFDSHANMHVVAEKYCTCFQDTGKVVDAYAFADSRPSVPDIPVKNVLTAHDDPYTGRTTILGLYGALVVGSMTNHLISTFLAREAGIIVNDRTKQHTRHPSSEDHAIIDPHTGRKITLGIQGIFSGFKTRALTARELRDIDLDEVMWLTPQNNDWNPYDPEYAALEAAYLDADGDMRMLDPGELRDTSPSELQVSSAVTEDHVYEPMMHLDD